MIVDTGILVAAANRRDRHHQAAKEALSRREPKIVPEPVVTETCFMLGSRLGGDVETAFVRALLSRALSVEHVTRQDRERVVELLEMYADASIGYVDAAVVAIAERLDEKTIATLDRRDFSLVRPRHLEAFALVP